MKNVAPKYELIVLENAGSIGVFIRFLSLEIAAWAVWFVILYPNFLSPLRHLPGPDVC